MKRFIFTLGAVALLIGGCTTTPKPTPGGQIPVSDTPINTTGSSPISGENTGSLPAVETPPTSDVPDANPVDGYSDGGFNEPNYDPITTNDISDAFVNVEGWGKGNFTAALTSFQRSCAVLMSKDADQYLSNRHPQYGKIQDWSAACLIAQATPIIDDQRSRQFFESEFLPVNIMDNAAPSGMITGYYQPEITARRSKDAIYSEPILNVPDRKEVLTWSRSKIGETSANPIAFGRPIDVFFMQIQGSGVLVFENGERIRAAYAANNGKSYTSIGGVLISRGILTKDQSSKQAIEDWMISAGPTEARALMNKNARYIFFKPETIYPGEGPKGAMQVPLTAMASIAVDPSQYPYGLPVWLETKIPNMKGDYRGQLEQLMVITQDTGKAIRGQHRADLYFGSGLEAGDRAGVMKHPASWTLLLPFHIALQLASIS